MQNTIRRINLGIVPPVCRAIGTGRQDVMLNHALNLFHGSFQHLSVCIRKNPLHQFSRSKKGE